MAVIKDTHITFRLSQEQKNVIENNARSQGRTMSNYLIQLAMDDYKKNQKNK